MANEIGLTVSIKLARESLEDYDATSGFPI
jgi:hypothetical protein